MNERKTNKIITEECLFKKKKTTASIGYTARFTMYSAHIVAKILYSIFSVKLY